MATPPQCYPPTRTDLILGLSDDDDEEEEEEDEELSAHLGDGGPCDGGGGVGEGLSTTPSTSSESGSSSLTARRTPPRPRVAKRSLRGELLGRWPGWTSPARKRLRSASPDPGRRDGALNRVPGAWPLESSFPATSASSGSTGLLARECDRFWTLVEKIASSTPSLLGRPADEDDDCERLCGRGQVADVAPVARTHSARSSSTPSKWTRRPRRGSRTSPQASSSSSASEEDEPPSTQPEGPALLAVLPSPQHVVLAEPDDILDGNTILPPPTPFSSPGVPKAIVDVPPRPVPPDDGVTREPPEPPDTVRVDVRVNVRVDVRVGGRVPPVATDDEEVFLDASEHRPRAELLERLQLLAGRPLPGSEDADKGDKADKLDPEEDSSVLQLLVLTPTEERKRAPEGGDGSAPGQQHRVNAVASKGRSAFRGLLRLRVPYFFILVGIAQVTLFASPSPYGATELKNRFVWNSSRLFREPWRTVSYAMLHSGQMHVALNVGVQTIVGTPLEREQGALRVAGVYFGGALYGAIVTGVVSPGLLMVGASAGIYSILTSHLAQIWLNSRTVRYGKTRACAVLLLTSADMAHTAHHALKRGNAEPRIGVTAHLAGAVSGLFLGLALYHTVHHHNQTAATSASSSEAEAGDDACCPQRHQHRAGLIGSSLLLVVTAAFCLVWIHVAQGRAQAQGNL